MLITESVHNPFSARPFMFLCFIYAFGAKVIRSGRDFNNAHVFSNLFDPSSLSYGPGR